MATALRPDDIGPAGPSRDRTIDPWTFLDYKGAFDNRSGSWVAPTWVGSHQRRLQAYRMLEEFYRNASRNWLPLSVSEEDRKSRREYGESYVLVEQYLSSVMGDDASIIVPEALREDASDAAKAFQEALVQWATDDQFDLKSEECERASIKLGDGVYVLSWNERAGRPTIEVWDPGFYFPVIDPQEPSNKYPKKVHLAYEFEEAEAGNKVRFVRRHTYELVDLVQDNEDGTTGLGTRKYAWSSKDSSVTCIYTVAVWRVNDIKVKTEDLEWSNAKTIEVDAQDLEIDWIPVVHIPCMTALAEHFGFSILSPVTQVLDDVITTDTDLQASSRMTGSPPMAVGGASLPTDAEGRVSTYGPGQVFQTGDGSLTMLDTSKSLDALLKYSDHILERLSVNSRIPESILGRVKPSDVPSGIALTISFGPHISVVKRMRKIRRHKYGILFKFIGRLMQANGLVQEIFPAELAFGSFIPADRMETLDMVVQALSAKPSAISLETAVRMLVEAGFPIDNAVEEVKKIQSRDFEGANAILDATADQNLGRAYLGYGPATTPQPPAPA